MVASWARGGGLSPPDCDAIAASSGRQFLPRCTRSAGGHLPSPPPRRGWSSRFARLVRVVRPVPPGSIQFFSQHQQGCRFGQGLVLLAQLALELLDALALACCPPPLRAGAFERLIRVSPPLVELLAV